MSVSTVSMCFSCKKKSENEAPCFWSLVGLVWSKPARPTRLRKASCLFPALRPKGKFYFLILFFLYFVAFERALSGRVWIKNLFFELFPMICIFSWWIKSLIPKIFWYGSRMTMFWLPCASIAGSGPLRHEAPLMHHKLPHNCIRSVCGSPPFPPSSLGAEAGIEIAI